ncbi:MULTISPECIES: antitoxin [unclassified Bifidobacterium]|uniref:type II toxin-antitoxin system BrnA family antitoxin n=1 Tax=unclassified Bifidobacterium TaxID=2608897 RepID=UPI0023F6BBA1|nr:MULTISPECIES: antitoxin [unclassified Bifidobacterium]WEV66149.1 antitoxin [Bifidobacterium sp. ESL0764]WEV75064.1 antitoxin [Bifidobacterium sp. ESL0800]
MKMRKAAELDRIFDNGDESILDYADMSTLRKPNKDKEEQRSLSLQMPEWLIGVLDGEAARVGISRQAVIKVWLTERADRMRAM